MIEKQYGKVDPQARSKMIEFTQSLDDPWQVGIPAPNQAVDAWQDEYKYEYTPLRDRANVFYYVSRPISDDQFLVIWVDSYKGVSVDVRLARGSDVAGLLSGSRSPEYETVKSVDLPEVTEATDLRAYFEDHIQKNVELFAEYYADDDNLPVQK